MISPEQMTLVKRIVVVALIAAVVIFGTFMITHSVTTKQMQAEAVRTGHARYIIVDDLGHTQFQWLEKNDVAPAPAPPVK